MLVRLRLYFEGLDLVEDEPDLTGYLHYPRCDGLYLGLPPNHVLEEIAETPLN